MTILDDLREIAGHPKDDNSITVVTYHTIRRAVAELDRLRGQIDEVDDHTDGELPRRRILAEEPITFAEVLQDLKLDDPEFETCEVNGCKGQIVNMVSKDGTAWTGSCCDTCEAKWMFEVPRPAAHLQNSVYRMQGTKVTS